MLYRYETHCHCSQCSRCGKSTSQELVAAYYRAGYAGLVLTDHFIFGNTCVDPNLPWKQRMEQYYGAWQEAREAAKGLDFDVFFGIEHHYGDGKEVLIYGISLPFLLENPDIPELALEELVLRVHAAGGVVIQAHPFRDRDYIKPGVAPRWDLVDGFELYNAASRPGEDLQTLPYRRGSYILTSGGDTHSDREGRIGLAGVCFDRRIRDGQDFAAALKENRHKLLIRGAIPELITEETLK